MINLGRCRLWAASSIEISTRAIDVVRATPVIDMLGLLTLDWARFFSWQQAAGNFVERDFRELETTGINVFHPAVELGAKNAAAQTQRWLNGWDVLLDNHPCFLARVETINDLLTVPKLGKLGVVVGFQSSDHFLTRNDVAAYYRLGQRVSQLTYNGQSRLGSGCKVFGDQGLTRFGSEVVAEMNRVGMAIDVSHCGDRTSLDAIAASRKPVLITHSNCRALVSGQPRCKTDKVIRRMAQGGGVMGITIVRQFVSRRKTPTLDDWLDHFDHVVREAGVEHVGLGSDADPTTFNPATRRPNPAYAIRGLDPELRIFQLAEGLMKRGYSKAAVGLVLGGNFQRALTEIWSGSPSVHPDEPMIRRDPFCPAPLPPGWGR